MMLLSRAFIQAAITERDANGMATKRHPVRTSVFAPKLWEYGVPFSVLEGRAAGKNWTVCLVPDTVKLPAEVLSDPDIVVLSATDADADIPIPIGARTGLDTKLLQTDLGLTLALNETPKELVTRIVKDAFGAPQFSVTDVKPL